MTNPSSLGSGPRLAGGVSPDESRPVRLTVYGAPRPRGSHTAGQRRDGTVYVRSAGREEGWVETVAKTAMWRRSQPGELPSPPYAVELAFYLPTAKRPTYPWPATLDVDKLARAVLDGLVRGGLLVDDRHVTELRVDDRHVTIATAGRSAEAA